MTALRALLPDGRDTARHSCGSGECSNDRVPQDARRGLQGLHYPPNHVEAMTHDECLRMHTPTQGADVLLAKCGGDGDVNTIKALLDAGANIDGEDEVCVCV